MSLSIVPPALPANEDWRLLLKMYDKDIASTPYNVRILFQNHPDYKGFIRWNKFTLSVDITGGALGECVDKGNIDNLVTWAQDHLVYKHDLNIGRDDIGRRLVAVAMENQYDPIQDYLNNLVWDGTFRLNSWMVDYCGAEKTDDGYANFVGRKWLLSCIARAFQPGCKADIVLVAEGEQGAHKSTMLKILGGDWYSEASGILGDKESKQHIGSAWICELPDMASFSRSNQNMMKAFFSSAVDRFRPPYGKTFLSIPRRTIFGATTNDEEYFVDPTGHRRFLPVFLREIDRARLIRDRDQLLAEAVTVYKASALCPACRQTAMVVPGEEGRCLVHAWWLSTEQKNVAKTQTQLREEQDPWSTAVLAFAANPIALGSSEDVPLTTENIWRYGLKSEDITRVGRREAMRIADIMKRGGYTRHRRSLSSVWERVVTTPPATPPTPLMN